MSNLIQPSPLRVANRLELCISLQIYKFSNNWQNIWGIFSKNLFSPFPFPSPPPLLGHKISLPPHIHLAKNKFAIKEATSKR